MAVAYHHQLVSPLTFHIKIVSPSTQHRSPLTFSAPLTTTCSFTYLHLLQLRDRAAVVQSQQQLAGGHWQLHLGHRQLAADGSRQLPVQLGWHRLRRVQRQIQLDPVPVLDGRQPQLPARHKRQLRLDVSHCLRSTLGVLPTGLGQCREWYSPRGRSVNHHAVSSYFRIPSFPFFTGSCGGLKHLRRGGGSKRHLIRKLTGLEIRIKYQLKTQQKPSCFSQIVSFRGQRRIRGLRATGETRHGRRIVEMPWGGFCTVTVQFNM